MRNATQKYRSFFEGQDPPESMMHAAEVLEEYGSDQDPVTYRKKETTARDMAYDQPTCDMDPRTLKLWFYGTRPDGSHGSCFGTVTSMIVDRIEHRRMKAVRKKRPTAKQQAPSKQGQQRTYWQKNLRSTSRKSCADCGYKSLKGRLFHTRTIETRVIKDVCKAMRTANFPNAPRTEIRRTIAEHAVVRHDGLEPLESAIMATLELGSSVMIAKLEAVFQIHKLQSPAAKVFCSDEDEKAAWKAAREAVTR